ncbi:MFS transporter [Amycolatopsis aidingensis]|uniref:MFS transporter n=1 Tax=Amycolatopsis aidingensis TaxID=2842453 RepID=UPI001C0DEEBC|nr:MFS transporter [Amycolatopsis aidingensis]
MRGSGFPSVPHEVRDFYGRRHRVGVSDRELLGRSRGWMLWAAWAAMLVASLGQYGYGALIPVLGELHGWTVTEALAVLAIWTCCQSLTVYPVARLRHRLRLAPVVPMAAGAVLTANGLITLGASGSFLVALLNHAVLGGLGAGLIYGTALGVVAQWYPERPARTSFVSGAFAYGAIPFLVLAGWLAGTGGVDLLLVLSGGAVLLVAGAAAAVLRDPPEGWWPAHIDPRRWAVDKSINPGLRNNKPAVRRYAPGEVLRTRMSALLYLAVACAAAVSLFDLAYLALLATRDGAGPAMAAAAVGVLAGASGLARLAAGWAGDRLGRTRLVRRALAAGAAAQLVLLFAGLHGLWWLLLAGAFVAGASAGTCYAVLPGLAEAHFGEHPGLPIFSLFYGAKASGGLIGIGLAMIFAYPAGTVMALPIVAVLSLVGAVLVRTLRRPGMPTVLPPSPSF